MTNHIIQISLDMDIERIQKIIEEQAARQIIEDIKQNVEEALFSHRKYYTEKPSERNRNGLNDMFQCIIEEYLNEIKPAIIEATSSKLTEKLFRSKAIKEVVGDVLPK